MPKIRIIVEDDQGNQTEQVHDLSGDLSNLSSIDEAVEQFKNAALPQIEQTLLEQAQSSAVAQEKKTLPDS